MLRLTRNLFKQSLVPNYGFASTQKVQKVTLLPGDGIGPEISQAVMDIFAAAKVPIEYEFHNFSLTNIQPGGDLISAEALDSIRTNKVALKGPFTTPIGKGYRSVNVTLRKKLNLFANVRPAKSLPGIKSLYQDVDVYTLRENTEGEYSGLEHMVVPGVCENLKIISRQACENIATYAFEFAVANNRKKVTVCHKAGVQKLGDGLFINVCKQVSQRFPQIEYAEEQVDTMCMRLARNPQDVDVMVMPNLYGDIVSDLCAGLVGGLGLTPSGNIGKDVAVYEAVHGSAPDIAGKGLANPTALLLSGLMMLNRLGMTAHEDNIRQALFKVFEEGKHTTRDVGGQGNMNDFVKAIINNLH
jgi:isocitrate dehydrogenase (NAD+)